MLSLVHAPRQTNCGQSCVLSISSEGWIESNMRERLFNSIQQTHPLVDSWLVQCWRFAFWRLNTNLVLLNPWIRVHRTINLLKSRLIDPTIYIAPEFLTEGNTLLPRFFSWPSWRAKALNDTRYTSSFGAKKTPWSTWGRTLIQYMSCITYCLWLWL